MADKISDAIDVPKGCTLKKCGGYTYVYYATRSYRNDKGKPTCDRTCIGKYDTETGKMTPNRNYYEVFRKEPIAFPSAIESFGTFAVFRKIAVDLGLKDIIKKTFGNRSDLLLSSAQYMFENGNAMYYMPDWQNENVSFFKKTVTSSGISDMFGSITADEMARFFKQWIKKAGKNELIAYDVTSISSYSKNIPELEWGYNRDKEKLQQINFAMYYGENSGIPYYYRTYPGSITDKMHLTYMTTDTNIVKAKKVFFVMDRGFYSKDNLDFLIEKTCKFVIALPELSYVDKLIDEHRNEVVNHFECLLGNGIIYGKKFEYNGLGYRMMIHIYYDPVKAVQDISSFRNRIEKMENEIAEMTEVPSKTTNYCKYFIFTEEKGKKFTWKRNEEKINRALGRCGIFAIADTLYDKSAEEILDIYRRRDTIEKAFDDLKNSEGMGRTYSHSQKTVDGKMFTAFIGLIVRSYMIKKLSEYMDSKNFSFKKIIIELNKIKYVYSPNMPGKHRLLNPVTKTQREILEALGFDENLVSTYS